MLVVTLPVCVKSCNIVPYIYFLKMYILHLLCYLRVSVTFKYSSHGFSSYSMDCSLRMVGINYLTQILIPAGYGCYKMYFWHCVQDLFLSIYLKIYDELNLEL